MEVPSTSSVSIFSILIIGIVLFGIALIALIVFIFIIISKALRRSKKGEASKTEKQQMQKSLAEAIRENRIRCGMTQEFVAEKLGVSRQAVSKWENGTSDPSTSNLLAIAKLYEISPEELLRAAVGTEKQNDTAT